MSNLLILYLASFFVLVKAIHLSVAFYVIFIGLVKVLNDDSSFLATWIQRLPTFGIESSVNPFLI